MPRTPKNDLQHFSVFDKSYTLPYQNSASSTKNEILMVATVLFAKHGYAAVSIKDIAAEVRLKPAALYNHFSSKETMWREVLTHAKDLYLLFFKNMEEQLQNAKTFEEVLQIIFAEPEKMNNPFTCYAFALIQAEQFRDEYASELYNKYLLRFAIDFVKEQLDKCIEKGLVASFDTWTVAGMYPHNVLTAINLSVQKLMGRATAYKPTQSVASLHQYILSVTDVKR